MQETSYAEWESLFIDERGYKILLKEGEPEDIPKLTIENFEVIVDTYEKPRPRIVVR
jgi:hypothetical protein